MISVIALTPGEPAGIGPDPCVQIAPPAGAAGGGGGGVVWTAAPGVRADRARRLKRAFAPGEWRGRGQAQAGVFLLPVPAAAPVTAGRPDPANAPYVIKTLETPADRLPPRPL